MKATSKPSDPSTPASTAETAPAKRASAKNATPKSAAAKKSAPPVDEADSFAEVTGSEAHYERFLPEAKAIPDAQVKPSRIDPSLAHHNILVTVAALTEQQARIAAELPALDMADIRALPELNLALAFAASQVDRGGAVSRELRPKMRRIYELRDPLLASAIALAAAGVVPASEVKRIQKGFGPIDAAQDCVDLAAFFRKHAAAVRGKTPITAAQLKEAAELGTELLGVLKPKSAKKSSAPKGTLKQAIETRDRIATLLVQRYERARRAGYWLWGDAFDQHTPALQARAASRKKAPEKGETKSGAAAKGAAVKGDAKSGDADK